MDYAPPVFWGQNVADPVYHTYTTGGGALAPAGGGQIPQAPIVPRINPPGDVVSGPATPATPSKYTTEGLNSLIAKWHGNRNTGAADKEINKYKARMGAGGGSGSAGTSNAGASNLVTNPFAPAAIGSAQAAGTAATGQAAGNFDMAAFLRNMGQQGAGAAGQALNTGFDPQGSAEAGRMLNTGFDPRNALYDRTAQQLQDQVRVGQAARGTTMSPYGAGQEGKTMSDFNIDWQNQQLGRQTQALGAFGDWQSGKVGRQTGALGAYGQYGGAAAGMGTSAANIGQQGVGQTQMPGLLPYEQSQRNQANDINNWLAIIGAGQTNYPLQLAQQSMTNAGGVPYIPQNSTNINF